jgi:polyhydroxyalkanoate synthesis repressor PhaR
LEAAVQQTEPIIIRKYANRRLYNTSSRRYINLDEIADLVRQGKDVRVVDAKTGEDLTRVILTQIIMEDARDQPTGLPLELLRQLIVASDRKGREFIMWYLKSAFDAYHRVQETALSPLRAVKNLFAGGEEGELEELRERVAELEARLGRGPGPLQ